MDTITTLTTDDLDTIKEASDALLAAWRKLDDVLELCRSRAAEELSPSGPWHERVRHARNIKAGCVGLNAALARLTQ